MIKKFARGSLVAASALIGCSAASAAVTVDFEGGTDRAAIEEFYNGGEDSAGASGPNLGISFSGAGFDASTATSPTTYGITSSIGYMQSSPLLFSASAAFNMIGFDQYFFKRGNVLTLFSGANGTGNVVYTGSFAQNCTPDCTFTRQDIRLGEFALSGTFQPNADYTGIDNLTLSAVPEPATWAMMIVGFGAVGAGMRISRRRQNSFAAA